MRTEDTDSNVGILQNLSVLSHHTSHASIQLLTKDYVHRLDKPSHMLRIK